MMQNNFWDNLSNTKTKQHNNNNFNLQEFLKFAKQMNGQDPNQMLSQMLSSGQITQEQLVNAKEQANGILQMLQSIGIIK